MKKLLLLAICAHSTLSAFALNVVNKSQQKFSIYTQREFNNSKRDFDYVWLTINPTSNQFFKINLDGFSILPQFPEMASAPMGAPIIHPKKIIVNEKCKTALKQEWYKPTLILTIDTNGEGTLKASVNRGIRGTSFFPECEVQQPIKLYEQIDY